MRTRLLGVAALAALGSVGCGTQSTFVKSDTTLGRVVVYRNGVAYFERYAEVQGDSLRLNVPTDKVDDFLKSLTVVDAATGEPAPISYPSSPAGGGTIDMRVGVGKAGVAGTRRLRLSYVTEAPSWKPSYRVVVGKAGKVELQGWAIVDNTSGEDWRDVKLGVGASSAMSFRFDLKGLRLVERETLRDSDLFAQAPPLGGASYGGRPEGGAGPRGRVVGDLTDDVLANAALDDKREAAEHSSPAASRAAPTGKPGPRPMTKSGASSPAVAESAGAPDPIQRMAQALRGTSNTIVVEGYASAGDKDKNAASLERANRLREQLVRNGVSPSQVIALGKGEQQGRGGGARVVEAPVPPRSANKFDEAGKGAAEDRAATTADGTKAASTGASEPIGTSHFETTSSMTVARGTSAMVSILRSETDGEVVYLYDPESQRGNAQYPFKTLRFRNPTDSALESGPVSVFGDGRFVGEGLSEPIPARSIAFVPFALDRQIVVEKKEAERDDIAKILTVQRGVFSTQIKHTRRATFTLYNRLPERATVYLRHTVAQGYALTRSPERVSAAVKEAAAPEHLAGAHLFRVDLEPNGKADVTVEEATPVFRSTDIRTSAGLDLVRAYLSSAALDGALKGEIEKLLKLNADMAKVEQQISTAREQMGEYRLRMDELHAQLVTLKAVKTAGPLMQHLEKKLQEISEKLSKATVDVVALQEKQMVARIQFQAGVGDLTLESKDGKQDSATADK
jgi:hypothetical protein